MTAEGSVRLLELNRPEQRNAASETLHTALAGVWDRLAADEAARAVVLTGRGRAFGAGGDFHVMTRVQRDEAFREQNVALPAAALRGTKRAVNLHLEHAMAAVMVTAMAELHRGPRDRLGSACLRRRGGKRGHVDIRPERGHLEHVRRRPRRRPSRAARVQRVELPAVDRHPG